MLISPCGTRKCLVRSYTQGCGNDVWNFLLILGGHRLVSYPGNWVNSWLVGTTEGRWKDYTEAIIDEAIIDEAVIDYIQLGHRISSFTLICGENVCRRGLMLLCWVHDDYSLSPVGRKMVLSVLCQSLILLLPWCIAELFVLFICGENVCRRGLMLLCWVHDDYSLSRPVGRRLEFSILCQSLVVLLNSRAFVPSRKEDGIEILCYYLMHSRAFVPSRRRMVLSILCQSLIA